MARNSHRTMIRYMVFFLSFCICFPAVSAMATPSVEIPLSIDNPSDFDRTAEPVTSGVPLSVEAGVTSINYLYITDGSGNRVPAQFTVLSRWNGTPDDSSKPIKWVLLDFQASVPAKSTATYYLQVGSGGNTTQSSLSITEDGDKITVNTGKARFLISKKHFNMFDQVFIDSDGDGQIDDPVVNQPGEGGIVLTDENGKEFTALFETPEEVIVEEQGPMRSVVKVRGVLKSADGAYYAPSITNPANSPSGRFSQPYPHSFFYYNARIHFYNDKAFVNMHFTIENNGSVGRDTEQYYAPKQALYFSSIYLVLNTDMGSGLQVVTEGSQADLSGSDSCSILQNWHENLTDAANDTMEPSFANGPYYEIRKNSELIGSGKTHPGWVDIRGTGKGIGADVRMFWQNFPGKIKAEPGRLSFGLLPEEGYYPTCMVEDYPPGSETYTDEDYSLYVGVSGRDGGNYLLDAGRHKTYEILLDFHTDATSTDTIQKRAASHEEPLMALASMDWIVSAKPFGMIAPKGFETGDPEIDEAVQRFEKHKLALVNEEDSENGYTIRNLKTLTNSHWEFEYQSHFFGWMNFGDLLWMNSPTALHYDWTYIMLLHYLRTGNRNFFTSGFEMAKHRYDVDQYHGERTDSKGNHKYRNFMQFYESSGHANPVLHRGHPSKVSANSHTWNGGLLLYYLMTGDRKAYEAAVENGKTALNHYGTGGLFDADSPECAQKELRMETWPILNLINLYRVTGESEYLRVAKNIAKNRLLYREQKIGGLGHFGSGGDGSDGCDDISSDRVGNVYWSYAMEAMVNIQYETGDDDLKQLLIRMADFIKDDFLIGGDFNEEGKYRPLQSVRSWYAEDPDGTLRMLRLDPRNSGVYSAKVNYSGHPIMSTFLPDLLAYVYRLTGDTMYLEKAREIFRDVMFHYSSKGVSATISNGQVVLIDGYTDPDGRATLSFLEGMFPYSHTKAHGWLGRTNQVYLYTEWLGTQGAFPLSIVPKDLPAGTITGKYQAYLSSIGGRAPYSYTITSGHLPDGLHLDASTGKIEGTPTKSGNNAFTVQVTDANGRTDSGDVNLTIRFLVTTKTLPNGIRSSEYTGGIAVTSGTAPYQFAVTGGALPAGLSLDPSNGSITGIPTEKGKFSVAVTITDADGVRVRKTFGIEILGENMPVANFTATPPSGDAPLEVTFQSLSENAVSFEWDFENDGTVDSTVENPVHVFETPGAYTVELTVINADGDTDQMRTTVTVTDKDTPAAAFSVTPKSGEAPLTVQVTNLSVNADGFEWDFNNDGVIDSTSTDSSLNYTFTLPGTYSISLKATNTSSGKTDTEVQNDVISVTGTPEPPTEETSVISGNCGNFPGQNCFASFSDWQANFGNIDFGSSSPGDLVGANKKVTVLCYNDRPQGFQDNVNIDGWVTDEKHNITITTPQSERHNGMIRKDGGYAGFTVRLNGSFRIQDDFTVIDGIVFDLSETDSFITLGSWSNGGSNIVFKNNIVYNGHYRDLFLGSYRGVTVYNNFFINDNSRATDYGAIDCGTSSTDSYHRIFNNTFFFNGDFKAIDGKKEHTHLEVKNNLCWKKTGSNKAFENTDPDFFENNISSDESGNPGNQTLEAMGFVSTVSGSADLHLKETSIARDAGSDLSSLFSDDIDGSMRNGSWDIGADECSTGSVPPPVSSFSGTPLSGTAPLEVSFTSEDTGMVTEWAWDFNGDGVIDSSEADPVFVYQEAGTYSVTLTVSNASGSDTLTRQDYIQVIPLVQDPAASFSANPLSGAAPLEVTFTNSSENATQWSWDFNGDGQSDSTEKNPVFIYEEPGVYTVSLTAGNGVSVDTMTKTGLITVSQVSVQTDFSAAPLSGTAPLTVTFTDLSANGPESWAWDFNGDGVVDASEQNPVFVYQTPGTYSVTLTTTNAGGTDSKTKTNLITVNGVIPQADFTADRVSGEAPLTVHFQDLSSNSPTAWSWDFDGDGIQDDTVSNPTHTFDTPGTFTVTLVASNAFGEDTEIKTGFINVSENTDPENSIEEVSVLQNNCDGVSNCFTSFSEWQAAFGGIDYGNCEPGDLVCADKIAVLECYNDWPEGLTDHVTIEGWKTDADHFIEIRTPESERHDGRVRDENGRYSGFTLKLDGHFAVKTDYTRIEGIVFDIDETPFWVTLGSWNKGGRYSSFSNNIVYNGKYRHLYLGDYQAVKVFNNFFINETKIRSGYGAIDCGPSNANFHHGIYNNSFYLEGDFSAIDGNGINEGLEVFNNLCVKTSGSNSAFKKMDTSHFQGNISSDNSGNFTGMTVSDILFKSTEKGLIDLHIQPGTGSVATDAGIELSGIFDKDMDGELRYGNWDIGADETSTHPFADFKADRTTGEPPLTVTFTNLSVNADAYEWDFDGDGEVDSTDPNPTFVYETEGTYSVTLLAFKDQIADEKTKTGFITVAVDAGAENGDVSIIRANCDGYSNCFTSLSEWQANFGGIDFGDCPEGDLVCAQKSAVVECYNDWPDGLQDAVRIEGWRTDSDHSIVIRTPDSERHDGRVKDENGKYTGFAIKPTGHIVVRSDFSVIEGLIIDLDNKSRWVSIGSWNTPGQATVFRNNIVMNGRYRHLYLGDYKGVYVYNNFFINETTRSSGYGAIDCGPSTENSYHRIFNNTFFFAGNFSAIDGNGKNSHIEIANNICYKKPGSNSAFKHFDSGFFENNISSDDSGTIPNQSLTDMGFVSTDIGSIDLHLQSPNSIAVDSGKNLSQMFDQDIDGSLRTGDWDVGADEMSSSM